MQGIKKITNRNFPEELLNRAVFVTLQNKRMGDN